MSFRQKINKNLRGASDLNRMSSMVQALKGAQHDVFL